MKNQLTTLALLVLLTTFTSCENENSEINHYQISKERTKNENSFLIENSKKIKGNWKIEKMSIVANERSEIFKNDTILYNIGSISIATIDKTQPKETRLEINLKGLFIINEKEIPFKSTMLHAYPEKDYIIGLIQLDPTNFLEPVMNSDQYESEVNLLNDYFFNDNYKMSISKDEKTLIWNGLERSTKEIIFTKIE